jgi:hypothetical protein
LSECFDYFVFVDNLITTAHALGCFYYILPILSLEDPGT